ncbi:hypothetical protein OS493_036383, partial [Desmophyllum pertusum]
KVTGEHVFVGAPVDDTKYSINPHYAIVSILGFGSKNIVGVKCLNHGGNLRSQESLVTLDPAVLEADNRGPL